MSEGTEKTMEELKRALEKHQEGNLAEAANICRGVLEREPENADAMHLLGVFEQQSGKPEAAMELFTRAAAHKPDDPALLNNLAAMLMGQGELEEAEKKLQQALDLDSTQAEPFSNLGSLQYRMGKLDEAEKNLELALRVRSEYPAALNMLGQVRLKQGKVEEAVQSFRKSIDVDPDNPDSHLSLGRALKRQDAMGIAIQCFENALELENDFLEAQVELAGAQIQAGDVEGAATTLRTSLQQHPNRPEPLVALGDLFRVQGSRSEAMQRYERAVRLQPSYVPGYLATAALLREDGETTDAAALLTGAVRVRADLPGGETARADALTLLAECLLDQGDAEGAAQHIVDALENDPLHANANITHARISGKRGSAAQGLKQLEALLKHPLSRAQRTATYMARAELLEGLGEYPAAFEAAKAGNEQLRGESPRPLSPEARPIDHDTLVKLKTWADDEIFDKYPTPPDDGRPEPTFLVDFPFSGTRLLRRLLNGQEDIHVYTSGGTLDSLWREFVADPEQLERLHFVGSTQESRMRRRVWRTIRQHLPPGVEPEQVIDWLGLRSPLVGPTYRFFPGMRALWLVRDPRDVVLDGFMGNRRWHHLMAERTDIESITAYYVDYMNAICAMQDRIPDAFYLVRLEDILGDTQPTLDAIGKWLDRGTMTISEARQATIDVAPENESRWQRYAEQLEAVQSALAPFVERFGYKS